jgi:hypothetical protein
MIARPAKQVARHRVARFGDTLRHSASDRIGRRRRLSLGFPPRRQLMSDPPTLAGRPVPADAIVSDPRWFPVETGRTDPGLSFVRAERAELASRAFLAENLWDTAPLPKAHAALGDLDAAMGKREPAPLHFIWHTAFCCSTLLTQLIDRPGRNLVLREPHILVDLANAKRAGWFARAGAERLAAVVFGLLSRRIADDHVTLKPATAANCLVRDAAALTAGKMLVLFSDCPSFLISVAQRGEARRAWLRRTFDTIVGDGNEQKSWSRAALFQMSDLQIAAIVWHMQMAEFQRSLSALPSARWASLDCDAFLDAPAETLARLDAFFGLGLGAHHIAEATSGPIMERNAKEPGERFNPGMRRAGQASIDRQLRKDVEAITAWSYELCRGTPRGNPLSNPLVPAGKSYFS